MGTSAGVSNLALTGGFGGLTETWSGNLSIPTAFGTVTPEGRFTATITSGASSWIDPNTVGISGAGSPLAVAQITSGPFSLTEEFDVLVGSIWTPYLNYYNNEHALYGSQMGFDGQFWYTESGSGTQGATPLPAALPLMGSVLGFGYFASKWRRRRGATPQI
jgi:hypothetical protein